MTLGIGEPFTTTVTVTLIFALILAMPVILLQVYGFLMPAFDPEQRRRMRPVLIVGPGLFITGVAFGYFIVLPAAVHFLQNFNADQFNVLVQAGPYYKFAATILLAMGLLFEIPVAIIAVTRAGVVTPRAVAPQPPLGDRGLRCGRGTASGRRDHDAAGDRSALSPLRAEPLDRDRPRAPRPPVGPRVARRPHDAAPDVIGRKVEFR